MDRTRPNQTMKPMLAAAVFLVSVTAFSSSDQSGEADPTAIGAIVNFADMSHDCHLIVA
jgi:hypothetical protein